MFAVFLLLSFHVALCGASSHMTHKLNHVWSNRELHSKLAKEIAAHQSNCSPKVNRHWQQKSGMGSDLHIWTQALCNSMQDGETLLQIDEPWIWNDTEFCKDGNHSQPFSCYFNLNKQCPDAPLTNSPAKWTNGLNMCTKYIRDADSRQTFRAAAIEYLFSNLNPRLVEQTEQSIEDVFGKDGIPENMITVHLRWGDKQTEMKLVSALEYYNAIDNIIDLHPHIKEPHIYVTTESPDGLAQLQEQFDKHKKTWKLHHYKPAVFDTKAVVSPMDMAERTKGSVGRHSLIALLLAMEGRYYVGTSGSNWTRLIDELRKTVVDVDCIGCTKIVDLRRGNPSTHNW